MRHFIFEFITGGGLSGQPLPQSLIREGELMAQTLLDELSELNNSEIALSRDSRLGLQNTKVEEYLVDGNIIDKIPKFLEGSDVSWLIAPETDGVLTEYTELFMKYGKLFTGSSPEAIRITTSKYLTYKKLKKAGINVVETTMLSESYPESSTGWVVKPDDGVGGENAKLIQDDNELYKLQENGNVSNFIAQPFVDGNHMSMSLLVFDNEVKLLACNKQYIEIINNLIRLKAIGVNECISFKNDMLKLANKIISTISGFAGYIGVDLIEVKNELFVLEINPRFTTAYAGISESINCNVTSKILDTFQNNKLPDIEIDSAVPVRINV